MPHINFAEALAEKSAPIAEPAMPSIFAEPPISIMESAYVEPAKFRCSRIGRSEWVNLSCAAIAIMGGLFSAFYFFNGAELFRSALAWPRELLYSRPLAADGITAGGGNLIPSALHPMARPSPKTDPSGDPFPRAGGPLTLDRPLYTSARESSNRPGGNPAIPSVPTPPGNPGIPGVPGVPGLPGGHLPGPGMLLSRLSLLVPGADQLTQALQRAAADLQKNITVTVRHDVSRTVNAPGVVRHVRVATRTISTANGGGMLVHGAGRHGRQVGGTVSTVTTSVSNSASGSGVTGSNGGVSGFGGSSTGAGLSGTFGMGGLVSIGGGGRGVVGGLGGAVGGVVGGLTGGSGRGGGGGGRH